MCAAAAAGGIVARPMPSDGRPDAKHVSRKKGHRGTSVLLQDGIVPQVLVKDVDRKPEEQPERSTNIA